jgi:hypothetical protein
MDVSMPALRFVRSRFPGLEFAAMDACALPVRTAALACVLDKVRMSLSGSSER